MRFGMLGPLLVTNHEGPVPVAAEQQRIVLAALLVDAGQVVSTESLAGAVWGQQPPRKAVNTVQAYVMRLRKVLGAGVLVTRGRGYQLVVGRDDVDAVVFERLVGTGRRDLDGGRLAVAADRLTEALELWRGPVFADLSANQALSARMAQLEELRLDVEEDRAGVLLDLGRYTEVVNDLQLMVDRCPLRERRWEQLMLALDRSGRRAEALDAYQRARTVLRAELGLDPGPRLRDLQRTILDDDAPEPEPAAAAAVPAQLPADVSGFVGRQQHLEQLDTLGAAAEPAATVVISALAGTAGVGKTALAVHWAHRERARFPDGQLYVNLRGYASGPPLRPIDALARFLPALGISAEQVPADEDEAAALYRSQIAGRRLLILLDNANHPDQVRPLLPGTPGCLVIVTSRNWLGGLIARDGAIGLALDVLTPVEAQDLLRRLLGPGRVATEPAALAELAMACGYLPLALRIAAANLAQHPERTVAGYLAELAGADRLSVLTVDGDHQAALRPAFHRSYAELPDDARRMFRLLGLVPGPDVMVPSAAALADVPPDEAERLLGLLTYGHLVEEPVPGRYALHDLLRLYAAELAAAEDTGPERTAATGRFYADLLRRVNAAAGLLYPEVLRLDPAGGESPFQDHFEALAWLDDERSSLVAAVRGAEARGHRDSAWRLTDGLRGYLYMGAHLVDWTVIAEAGMTAANADGNPRARAAMHLNLALIDNERGRNDQALDQYVAAAELSRAAGWRRGESAALGNLGALYWHMGRLVEAVEQLEAALAIDREIGWRAGQAPKLANLAVVWMDRGVLAKAMDCNVESLRLHRESGSRVGQARTLNAIGDIHHLSGRLDEAETALDEALSLREGTGDRTDYYSLCTLGGIHLDAGRHDKALELAEVALELAKKVDDRRIIGQATGVRGGVRSVLGEHRRAVGDFRTMVLAARSIGNDNLETEGLACLADALRHAGHPGLAFGPATQALAIARRVGLRLREGQAMTVLAAVHLDRGEPARAGELAVQAMAVHIETGHHPGLVRAQELRDKAAAG